jgi:hypothetical protein
MKIKTAVALLVGTFIIEVGLVLYMAGELGLDFGIIQVIKWVIVLNVLAFAYLWVNEGA